MLSKGTLRLYRLLFLLVGIFAPQKKADNHRNRKGREYLKRKKEKAKEPPSGVQKNNQIKDTEEVEVNAEETQSNNCNLDDEETGREMIQIYLIYDGDDDYQQEDSEPETESNYKPESEIFFFI